MGRTEPYDYDPEPPTTYRSPPMPDPKPASRWAEEVRVVESFANPDEVVVVVHGEVSMRFHTWAKANEVADEIRDRLTRLERETIERVLAEVRRQAHDYGLDDVEKRQVEEVIKDTRAATLATNDK